MNKQTGASSITMLLMVVLSIAGLVTVLKVVPLYTQDMAVKTVFESITEESDSNELERDRVESMIEKRFSVNNISELMEFVEVGGQGATVIIEMEYERRVSLVSNIELVATFKHYVDLSE